MRIADTQPVPQPPADATRIEAGAAVAELVRFRAAQDIEEKHLILTAKATEAIVRAQPGFRARHLIRAMDGTWTDLVIWESLAQAQSAAREVTQAAAFAPFLAAIDVSSIDMSHQTVLWSIEG